MSQQAVTQGAIRVPAESINQNLTVQCIVQKSGTRSLNRKEKAGFDFESAVSLNASGHVAFIPALAPYRKPVLDAEGQPVLDKDGKPKLEAKPDAAAGLKAAEDKLRAEIAIRNQITAERAEALQA